jgi:hypothetical protein
LPGKLGIQPVERRLAALERCDQDAQTDGRPPGMPRALDLMDGIAYPFYASGDAAAIPVVP